MANYIDGFVLPVPRKHLATYQRAAEKIADIWREHGALAYVECVGDDLELDGARSFTDLVDATEDEVVVFGWTVFPSREVRDRANARVPEDPRMPNLVAPLTDPATQVFDAGRMVFGGFRSIVQSQWQDAV
ncbi:MAG: DUF1428 domain-containing protein [Saprospiraceae bacterium]|nr:DUF1428 domain-containing protein [Saprospiraceae bacterium]